MLKVDEIGQLVTPRDEERVSVAVRYRDLLKTLARLAECYVTGQIEHDAFVAGVRKALGIAETPEEAVDRVFEENKEKFEGVGANDKGIDVEPQETVLPWREDQGPTGEIRIVSEHHGDYTVNDGWIIAELLGPDAERNREAIIRAVNNYRAILSETERITRELARLREVERAAKALREKLGEWSLPIRLFDYFRVEYYALETALSIGEKEGGQ